MTAKKYIVTGGDSSGVNAWMGGHHSKTMIDATLEMGNFPEGLQLRHIPTGRELIVMGEECHKQSLKWQCETCKEWIQNWKFVCKDCEA